jgi:hypothetical protein
MTITLPEDLSDLLRRVAAERNTTPEDLLRDWLNQQVTLPEAIEDNPLLRTSLSVEDMEPAIPTEDLSVNFKEYLHKTWGKPSPDE